MAWWWWFSIDPPDSMVMLKLVIRMDAFFRSCRHRWLLTCRCPDPVLAHGAVLETTGSRHPPVLPRRVFLLSLFSKEKRPKWI